MTAEEHLGETETGLDDHDGEDGVPLGGAAGTDPQRVRDRHLGPERPQHVFETGVGHQVSQQR